MDVRKYKVLHIFSGYGGGISSLLVNLIENKSDDFDFDVMAFSLNNGEQFIERLAKVGCQAYEMPRPRIDGYKAFNTYVKRIMSSKQYDAVHCHITGWSMLPFYIMARRAGIKSFFLHAHTTKYDRKLDRMFPVNQLNKLINYKCSNGFFTCSDLAADYIYGSYTRRRKPILIPNGITEEKFLDEITDEQRERYRKLLGITTNETVLLHVGRFSPAKNHDFMLKFANSLKKQGLQFKLLLVGDGELLETVKNECSCLNLNDLVLFLGRRMDISYLMQFCDLMILPSIYEGLPTVAVECQAAGTPMLLASHITKQCDMGLGLLEFLPLESMGKWIIAFTARKGKADRNNALKVIEEKGFTASIAGREYCNALKGLIDS